MAPIRTRDFGEIEPADDAVIEFPCGLPAFEDQRRFILIQPPALAPVAVLQSTSDPSLAFTAVPVSLLDAGYELSMLPEDFEALGSPEQGEVAVYALLTFAEHGPVTANLLAPVVVNTAARKAVQAVRSDSRYSHRHPVGEGSCS